MATVSLYLDTRYERPDGLYLVKIKVSLPDHRNIQINTTIRIAPNQWDKDRGRVIIHENKLDYNNRIGYKLNQVGRIVVDMEQSGELYRSTPAETKKRIEEELGRVTSADNSFIDYLRKFTESKTKRSTRESYEMTLAKIDRYTNGASLRFESITFSWLTGFQKYMDDEGLSINSQSIMFRNIRSAFNQAINEDRADLSAYPFRKFKIRKESTRKRSLTIEQLRQFRDYDCEESQIWKKRLK